MARGSAGTIATENVIERVLSCGVLHPSANISLLEPSRHYCRYSEQSVRL
jgi:hypothetical protein